MLIGSSQVNITPEVPFAIQGHYYLRMGRTVLDPLYASCVVIDDENQAITMISCDLAELPDGAVTLLREKIQALTGLEPGSIILCATHTHQGPVVSNKNKNLLSWCARDEEKFSVMLDRIALSAVEAYNNRQPARIGYGKGTVERCGFNRRYIMSDGKSYMNPKRGYNPDRLMVEGPVDKEVQVIWFEDLEGNHIAIMVNFAGHPTSLFSTEYISGDYVGAMRSDVQTLFGQIPVVFLQGSSGNIDTYDFEHDENWGDGIDGYKRIGRIIAGEVMKILSGSYAEEMEDLQLTATSKIVQLPYKDIHAEELAGVKQAWEGMSEEERDNMPFDQKVHSTRLMHLDSLKQANHSRPAEISVIKLGDLIIATVPCEYFVEYQLDLKQRFKDHKVIITELVNGSIGYIPTKLGMALGGYESISSMFTNEAGGIILDGLVDLIQGQGN